MIRVWGVGVVIRVTTGGYDKGLQTRVLSGFRVVLVGSFPPPQLERQGLGFRA